MAALCLVSLACGLHLFLGWLHAQRPKPEAEGPSPPWRLRWTLSLLGVAVLMFVAGIAAVGVTHQTAWLLTSPEPWSPAFRRTRSLLASLPIAGPAR